MIRINDTVVIDDNEISFEFARSSGPGGQNVNKVETKSTLLFAVNDSAGLRDAERALIHERLGGRINKAGILRVTCQRHRTREANRRECLDRFVALLADALSEEPERRPTRTPARAKKRRLEEKRRRARLKQSRGPVDIE